MLSNLNHQNRTISLNQFPDVNQFIDPGLLKRREGWLPLRKSLATLLKIYMPKIIYDLSPRLFKRGIWPFSKFTTNWGKGKIQSFEDYWTLALK